uniref:Uncharacterized protein n=1 Tax=Rhizophora mucronata TaxID=61149 RepID=A0A2P2P292_RHIMU
MGGCHMCSHGDRAVEGTACTISVTLCHSPRSCSSISAVNAIIKGPDDLRIR